MTIIRLVDHPANLDPTAVGMTRGRGPGIYKTRAGFVVSLFDGRALDGYFATIEAALEAQRNALLKPRKPRVGDAITYEGAEVGKVVRVEGNLCYRTYPDGEVLPFIWRFHDGTLNRLHSWPGK